MKWYKRKKVIKMCRGKSHGVFYFIGKCMIEEI